MSANNQRRTGFLGYDLFKLIVTLVLLVILILLLLRGCGAASGSAAVTAQPTAAQTETSTQPGGAAQAGVAPSITSPKDGDSLAGASVTLEGTGQAGASIQLLDSDKPVSTASVGSDGKWSAQVTVTAGQHSFVAASADGAQKSAPVVVTVGEGLAITSPKDGDHIQGTTVNLEGTGAAGIDLFIIEIYDDTAAIVKSVTVGADGKFSTQIEASEGGHTYAAAMPPPGKQPSDIDPIAVLHLAKSNTVTVIMEPATTPTLTPVPPTATPAVASGCAPGGISGFLKDQQHYVVGSCDTLSGIAVFLNVSVETLLASNPQITNPNVVIPGEVVNVPPK